MYVYGQVAPGNTSGPGTLTVGNLYFANGSSAYGAIADVTSYSQLQVAPGDTVTLGGAYLSVRSSMVIAPTAGQRSSRRARAAAQSEISPACRKGAPYWSATGCLPSTYDGGAGNDNVVLTSMPAVV